MKQAFQVTTARSSPEPCAAASGGAIIILGDTQRTGRLEGVFLGRERNETHCRRLLAAAQGEDFSQFIHLGDAVYNGGSGGAWRDFDVLAGSLLTRGSALLVPGNHDYRGTRSLKHHAALRFPHLKEGSWSNYRHGDLAFICLDSNRRRLGSHWVEQRAWYRRELARMEEDPAVGAVLVLTHHPPFTNSRSTGDGQHVQDAFLSDFFKMEKTRVFLSGHAHGYERFEKHAKTFVVAGGGGGPRVRYHQEGRRRHVEQFIGPGPRPFHYLLMQPAPGGWEILVKGFDPGDPLEIIDRVSVETLRQTVPATI